MATLPSKKLCIKCNKTKATARCGGCLQEFCIRHFTNHRQELNQHFDKLTIEQTTDMKNHPSMKQIDKWEFQQQTLLVDANARSAVVEELDVVKAQSLATLERDLNLRQEMILDEARKRIDELNEEANRLKIGVLREAQAQANAKVKAITEHVAALNTEDVSRLFGQ
ncbi:unnamed protein product [Adineta ricciae]|uniref:Uncharacterized protein n=1 Tax=Adineta ricciae TaxID=249248 RepID=A0A814FQJ4_ADIRI|nr:unnamed protein product [Adineta ricciae]CAF1257525.1 unnamed protein product [Adineta ricciae]